MEVKPDFKLTEVGVIPKDWTTITLENATIEGGLVRGPFGGTLKKEIFVEQGYKVYEQGNAIYSTINKGNYFIDSNKYKELERFQVHPNDFIVSCSGTIGSIFQIPIGSPEGVINQALLKISLDEDIVNSSFFLEVFRSAPFQSRIKENTHGGAMQNLVGMETFRKTLFQLPPTKAEQEAIAEALRDADAYIESLEQLIAKKRLVKQGVMQELLTSKRRLPGFRGDWERKCLGEISIVVMGQSPDSNFYNSHGLGIPLIQGNADISNRKSIQRVWTTQVTKSCQEGDILLAVRAPVGEVGIASQDSCLGRGVCAVKATNIHRDFLLYTLIQAENVWKDIEQGSTFTSVNSTQVNSLKISHPVSREEQIAISTVLNNIETEILSLEQQRDKSRLLKQGMMQELLTGRIRVV